MTVSTIWRLAGQAGRAIALLAVPLTAAATNPTLVIRGNGGTAADVTAFVDNVQIINTATGTAVATAVVNGSFETPNQGANTFTYNTTGATWTFSAHSGISQNGSGFGNAAAPDGVQVAIVQTQGGQPNTVSQQLTLGAGKYKVQFQVVQRNFGGVNDQTVEALIDGVSVGTIKPTSATAYTTFLSSEFVVDAPTISGIAPVPGGLGQQITITGTNLGSATSVLVNGINATSNIISNTSTSIMVRVPVGTPATGTTTVTTAAGSATSTAFTVMAAPGNALAFDGTDDYVALPTGTAVPVANSAYTIEAWIKPTAMSVEGIIGWGNYGTTNQVNALRLTTTGIINYWWGNDLTVTTGDLTGRWHHVAATFDGTTRIIYLDGVAVGSDTPTGHAVPNANNLRIGSTNGGEYFAGGIDEVRVWTTSRTLTQVQADMRSAATVPTTGLVAYFNMDQGTPSGNNTGLSTVYDLANAYAGTLTNFTLSSGSTSNWVESYAMVVPTATAATPPSSNNTSLIANWTAPTTGTVTNYVLDVATTSSFSAPISGSPFTVAGTATSYNITGLTPGATYYYRVRANKTSVTGQGAYSNVITATVPATLACSPANNALNFDGSSDYVRAATTTLPAMNAATIEGWVFPETLTGGSGYYALLNGDDYVGGTLHFQLTDSRVLSVGIGSSVDATSSFTLPLNTWSHIAVVFSTTTQTLKFYLNGVLQNTATTNTNGIGAQAYTIGAWTSGGTQQRFFDGSLNELRVWNVARTDAQIAANYNQALAAQAGLVALYSFDQGTASGTNTGLTTLKDEAGGGRTGTLNTFALTGSSSNWVAGNTLSTTLALTSFSPANGSVGGTVTLTGSGFTGATGVSFNGTAATAFTVVNSSTITATIPSGATTGPISVTGACGTVTSSGTLTVCPVPVAIAQNVTLPLNASGSATIAAAALNNGSTPTSCGTLTATAQKIKTGYAAENGSITLTAPAGMVFTSVVFASYGTPTANANGTYTINSGCHATSSQSVVETALLNKNSGTIGANNTTFGDPCVGTVKRLAVIATYGPATPATQLTYSCSDQGANQVLLTMTDASGVSSSTLATVTVVDNLAPGVGNGPLPAAPASALANVPEAAGYGILYQLDVPNTSTAFNTNAVPYTANNSSAAIVAPTRVAYYMELTNGTSTKWVWASMDNFAANLTQLGLPALSSNGMSWHQNVANLNVFASANAGVTTGINLGVGRIEMWPWDYNPTNSDNVPNASGSTYDFGDQPTGANNYGSFQVHNVTAQQTVLAYNNWGGDGNLGDLGIGTNTDLSNNKQPDWTFTYNAATYTVKRITILVPNLATFTQPAAVALGVSGSVAITPSQVYKGNLTDNCGITSIAVSPSTFNCTNLGANTVTLTLTDAAGNITSGTTTVTVSVPTITSTTWNGSTNADWNDCRNWSYGQVPTATISAVIPAGTANTPLISSTPAYVNTLAINANGNLALTSSATLQVNGDWTSNSTNSSFAGTVSFMGTTTQTITNTGTAFGNVQVNKASGTVQLGQHMAVGSSLVMAQGLLLTGSYQVQLGSSATLTESENNYIVGNVAATRTLSAGSANVFGGMGLTLTPASGSTAPGVTAVVRTTGTALTANNGNKSVQRYFDIQPATNTGLNVTMDFSYFDHEIGTIPKANLVLFKSTTSTSGPWTPMGGTSNVGSSQVTKAGLTDFSIWTLGNTVTPLPVELLDFTATAQGTAVALAWHTASEVNSDRFEIERSVDGNSFGKLGTVAAHGTTILAQAYAYRDALLPTGATMLYYRLRQVDLNGTAAYSPVRTVAMASAGLALFPNPTHAAATLTGAMPSTAVVVLDAVGRTVLTTTTDATGTATLALPAGLPAGVYVVRAGSQMARLTVE